MYFSLIHPKRRQFSNETNPRVESFVKPNLSIGVLLLGTLYFIIYLIIRQISDFCTTSIMNRVPFKSESLNSLFYMIFSRIF